MGDALTKETMTSHDITVGRNFYHILIDVPSGLPGPAYLIWALEKTWNWKLPTGSASWWSEAFQRSVYVEREALKTRHAPNRNGGVV